MISHRKVIYPFLCASVLLTSGVVSAQSSIRPTTSASIGQAYTPPNRTQVGTREDQTETQQQDQQTPNDQRTARPQANARVVPGQTDARKEVPEARVVPGNDTRNDTRVMPGSSTRSEARVVPGNNGRVVPGANDKRAPAVSGNRVVPGGEARVVPGGEARVIPGSNAVTGGRVMPGTRAAGQRPILAARTLPTKIVIDRRSAACPYVTLTPYAISKKGDLIELADGSVWEVRHRDRRSVKRWSPGDAILVETGKFLSWSSYRLVNYTRGEYADVELAINTDFQGRYSHWVVEVNPFQGFVRLEDGTIWHMSAADLAQWRVNDDVIIGLSKDFFSDQYSYILINPRAKNRIIAVFEF